MTQANIDEYDEFPEDYDQVVKHGIGWGTVIVISLAMICLGIAAGWIVKGDYRPAPARLASPNSMERPDAHSVFRTYLSPASFVGHLQEIFPEAQPELSSIAYTRGPRGHILPSGARVFIPVQRFTTEFNQQYDDTLLTGSRKFFDAGTVDGKFLTSRLRELVARTVPSNVVRCPQHTVGYVQEIRNPDWDEYWVREVRMEFNLGC